MPPNATVVPAQNYKRGIEMLEHGEIDTYATNKPTLFEMSDQMSGAWSLLFWRVSSAKTIR